MRQLEGRGLDPHYEEEKLEYTVPASTHKYTPDFHIITASGKKIYIEAKGMWDTADRMKMLHIRRSNPDVEIRMVFQRAAAPIRKGSPTSYGKWASKHGIVWADKGTIPDEWFEE
ncbi:MAG: hypothetical protein R3C97_11380 [Geminicoccaceae bacterium]